MAHWLARTGCHPKVGQTFCVNGEEFSVEGAIGDGAVGIVRKARRKRDQKPFALKFLAPDPKYIDETVFDDVAVRFRREGERGAKLDHNSLLRIHAYVPNSGGDAFGGKGPVNPFLLMECVRGRTLEHFIRRSSQSGEQRLFSVTKDKLSIAVKICEALTYLHKQKLVHRDVKPANVFLSSGTNPGSVKLGDFGIMKWGDFHASLATGALTATSQQGLGTLKYMSPEQAVRPKDVTNRSDIFSLGITLFELFTDQILLSPHHVFEVMNARLILGTTTSRYHQMGYALPSGSEVIAELLLDMHLRGITRRPSIDKVLGRLQWSLEYYTA